MAATTTAIYFQKATSMIVGGFQKRNRMMTIYFILMIVTDGELQETVQDWGAQTLSVISTNWIHQEQQCFFLSQVLKFSRIGTLYDNVVFPKPQNKLNPFKDFWVLVTLPQHSTLCSWSLRFVKPGILFDCERQV